MPRLAARRPKKVRGRRAPKVAYELLTPESHPHSYERLARLVEKFHDDLTDARIALAWCTSWRVNVDGQQQIGRCKRASNLDRELAAFDFVVLLNREFWEHAQTTDIVRDALLDHELCHATTRDDPDTGEPMRDERGRICYRLRRHDVEDFHVNVSRFGLWRRELDAFARALAVHDAGPRLAFDDPDTAAATAPDVH